MKYVVLVVLVLLLATGGLTFAHRWAYGTFPWGGGPDRVQWCERRYYRSPENERLGRDLRLKPIFRAPLLVGDHFYAQRSASCGVRGAETLLYRSVGDGEYEVYELSGGP